MIGALVARDVRRGLTGSAWLTVAFFLLIVALMPFAVGPDARLLARIASGVLWIAALTAALLPIERLIEPDRADGMLDQLAVRGIADESIAAAPRRAVRCPALPSLRRRFRPRSAGHVRAAARGQRKIVVGERQRASLDPPAPGRSRPAARRIRLATCRCRSAR